jgi:hypothetical protein
MDNLANEHVIADVSKDLSPVLKPLRCAEPTLLERRDSHNWLYRKILEKLSALRFVDRLNSYVLSQVLGGAK